MSPATRNEEAAEQRTWGEAARAFLHPRVLAILFLGFSAGLPLFLIFGTLSVWLREAGIERSTLTFFSWAALGYSFKYVWAPLVDRLPLPWLTRRLGRRRGWLLFAQIAVMLAMFCMAASDPQKSLTAIGIAAVLLGFSSATQDIAIDAYRIEAVARDLQAMMASAYVAGYRAGMLLGGAGALKLASVFGDGTEYSYRGWALAYVCMGFSMLVGMATTLVIAEPRSREPRSDSALRSTGDYLRFLGLFACAATAFTLGFVFTSELAEQAKTTLIEEHAVMSRLAGFLVESGRLVLSVAMAVAVGGLLVLGRMVPKAMVRETYVDPFSDFMRRYGKSALLLLLLIGTYRISDIVMGAVANVFYIDMGYTKDQIAAISKTFGLFMTLAGGFVSGLLAVRYGLIRILFLGALLSAATNVLFAYLATVGNDPKLLIGVIVADNLSGGMATAAFVAYLSSLTSVSFTATQYALFSSIMTLGPKVLAGYSGMAVDSVGYETFFIGTAILGLPVLVLVWLAGRIVSVETEEEGSEITRDTSSD